MGVTLEKLRIALGALRRASFAPMMACRMMRGASGKGFWRLSLKRMMLSPRLSIQEKSSVPGGTLEKSAGGATAKAEIRAAGGASKKLAAGVAEVEPAAEAMERAGGRGSGQRLALMPSRVAEPDEETEDEDEEEGARAEAAEEDLWGPETQEY